jgi:hypothetical protein
VNVVDSSGWLEYFAGGRNADFFADPIEATEQLLVPTISLYEVCKRVLQQRDEGDALQAAALMQQGSVVEVTSSFALGAARLSVAQRGSATADGRQPDAGHRPSQSGTAASGTADIRGRSQNLPARPPLPLLNQKVDPEYPGWCPPGYYTTIM